MEGMLTCFYCEYSTEMKWNLKRHISNIHTPRKPPPDSNRRFLSCKMCKYLCSSRPQMIGHYSQAHSINCTPKLLQFKDRNEFETWKNKVEVEDMSRYIRGRGVRRVDHTVSENFVCYRDGFCRTRGTGKRRPKRLGSNKIDGCCPSQMTAVTNLSSGCVMVKFIKTHVGHSNDLERLPLAKKDRQILADKIASGLSFDSIIDIMRKSVDTEHHRLHRITHQDLANVARDFNLRVKPCRAIDFASVDSWVVEAQNSSSVVRFYKPKGTVLSDFPELSDDNFTIVLATDDQVQMLFECGTNIVCFDGTRVDTTSEIELTTLYTVTDTGNGYPCFFMLSNGNDATSISLLAHVVKYAFGEELACTVFTSDMNDMYYDGWTRVMPQPVHRLYNSWHVLNEWRAKLSGIADQDKREDVYKRVEALLEELDDSVFPWLMEVVTNELQDDPTTEEFGNHFASNYKDSAALWANCYRQSYNSGDKSLELAHKSVMQTYLKARKSKHLNQTLDVLINMTSESCNQNGDDRKPMTIKKKHEYALSILQNSIVLHTDSSWFIKTEKSDEAYKVTVDRESCECSLKCNECQCCVHNYKCSCSEMNAKWNMCEHVHIVAMQNRVTMDPQESTEQVTEEILQICEATSSNEQTELLLVGQLSENDSFESRLLALDEMYEQIKSELKTVSDIDFFQNHLMSILTTVQVEENVQDELSS